MINLRRLLDDLCNRLVHCREDIWMQSFGDVLLPASIVCISELFAEFWSSARYGKVANDNSIFVDNLEAVLINVFGSASLHSCPVEGFLNRVIGPVFEEKPVDSESLLQGVKKLGEDRFIGGFDREN